MSRQRLLSLALVLVVPMCEAQQSNDSVANLCPTPERSQARFLPWLAGGLLAGMTALRLGPAAAGAAAIPPATPPEEREAVGRVCVWVESQPAFVTVRVASAGDTLVASEAGDWVDLRERYPAEPTASYMPWYLDGESIEYAGRTYVPFGGATREDGLHRIGETEGVPVLAHWTINSAPGTIYVPLDGCVYQPYRARMEVRPRG